MSKVPSYTLNAAQKEAVANARTILDEAFAQVDNALSKARFSDLPDDLDAACQVRECHCRAFDFGARPGALCARGGCRHPLSRHQWAE